jgi:hypothetical protein
MRAYAIHLAACWPAASLAAVEDALSAYARGGDRRCRRLQPGVYQLGREEAPFD